MLTFPTNRAKGRHENFSGRFAMARRFLFGLASLGALTATAVILEAYGAAYAGPSPNSILVGMTVLTAAIGYASVALGIKALR